MVKLLLWLFQCWTRSCGFLFADQHFLVKQRKDLTTTLIAVMAFGTKIVWMMARKCKLKVVVTHSTRASISLDLPFTETKIACHYIVLYFIVREIEN